MDTKNILLNSIIIILLTIQLNIANCAVAHQHNLNKERTEDGAYIARDAHHHSDTGEHNDEFDHEAILGGVKEAKEFHQLSPEESKARLAILVKSIDLNLDGFVDRHELKAWVLRSFRRLAEEEGSERFYEVDLDGDELVTWKEFLKDTFDKESEDEPRDPYQSPHAEEENKMIANDKEMFKIADVDKDGHLNLEEFIIFYNPEEHAEMFPVILNQTLRDKDKNGDSKIDFQEFIGESAKNHDKEWLISEKETFDHEYDKDGDGVLNANEILSWVLPSNEDIATDEVDHLFVISDKDQDDRLSYEEIIENYETFVGSEATNFGDHLQNIHHFQDEL